MTVYWRLGLNYRLRYEKGAKGVPVTMGVRQKGEESESAKALLANSRKVTTSCLTTPSVGSKQENPYGVPQKYYLSGTQAAGYCCLPRAILGPER